jgi:hypothetical protein
MRNCRPFRSKLSSNARASVDWSFNCAFRSRHAGDFAGPDVHGERVGFLSPSGSCLLPSSPLAH